MEIEQPVVLARLPRPVPFNGVIRFAPVYSVRAGQKRKRQEICTAIDGDSVSIYDVQNGRLLASHPVPPTSTFCCKPCSHKTHDTHRIRQTYCVIQKGEKRIHCFKDDSPPKTAQLQNTLSMPLAEDGRKISHIETIEKHPSFSSNTAPHELLVIFQDGLLSTFSASLEERTWVGQLRFRAGSQLRVLCTHLVDPHDARLSFLSQRPDLLAGIDPRTSLLAVVFVQDSDQNQKVKKAWFGVWSLGCDRGAIHLNEAMLDPILTHSLPHSNKWLHDENATLDFGRRAQTVSIGHNQGSVTYELSSPLPQLAAELYLNHADQLSSSPISTSLVASTNSNSIKIFDSKFTSVQASLDLDKALSKSKRKRSKASMDGGVRLVANFARLRRLLAVSRQNLLAIDIRLPRSGNGRILSHKPTLLIDSLGRGQQIRSDPDTQTATLPILDFGTVIQTASAEAALSLSARKILSDLAKDGNVEEFEAAVAKEIQTSDARFAGRDGDSALPKVIGSDMIAAIGFVISCIFRYVPDNDGSLQGRIEVVLPARRSIAWLSRHGMLLQTDMHRALSLSVSPDTSVASIAQGAIARALMDTDPSLSILQEYLQGCRCLGLVELLATIKLLLAAALQDTAELPLGRLMEHGNAQTSETSQDLSQTKRNTPPRISRDLAVYESSGSKPQWNVPTAIRRCLNVAVASLGAYAASAISLQLRSMLTPHEVLALVQILRQQLFYGGHTKFNPQRSDSSPAPSETGVITNEDSVELGSGPSLDALIRCLSACIDAIGPIGFLAQGDNDDFIENLIPDLKSEIARATEAIEEATYLQGILRETLRYADSFEHRGGHWAQAGVSDKSRLLPQRPGTIITLYTESFAGNGDTETKDGILPLSLQPDNIVKKTKIRKGGGQILKRSAREMHLLQARQKGRYSFERLML